MTHRRAFTLIELMAVTLLLVGAVGWATLSMRGLGDNQRIQAAAEAVFSAYRLAALQSRTSGLPAALHCDATACTVRKPQWMEDEWRWIDGAQFAWPEGVKLRTVSNLVGGEPAREAKTWTIPVPAHPAWWTWICQLCLGARLCAAVEIDAFAQEYKLNFQEVARGN